MKKRSLLLLAFLTVVFISAVGTVSAAENDDTHISISPSSEENQDNSRSPEINSEPSDNLNDPIIQVKVNYEYPSDSGINPDIIIEDTEGNSISFNKINDNNGQYILNFNYDPVTDGSKFLVTVSAPGYQSQTQEAEVYRNPNQPEDPNFYASLEFNLQATPNYTLGYKITKIANRLLNFKRADEVLCITTAGVPQYNGTTTEDCIEGILNQSYGLLSFGQGNILMLRKTPVDSLDFMFVVKKGNSLQAVFFKNGSSDPVYQGTISQNMKNSEWNQYAQLVGADAFSYASLANAWANGAPSDLLREAAFHGHMCQGTISGYVLAQTLIKYYPPIQETPAGGGSPGDITSYKVLSVPGGSEDDAIMNFLDATPGKGGALAGFDTGVENNLVAFVRWNDNTKTGDLIIMKYNLEENRQTYCQLTGKQVIDDTISELQFNTWLLQQIKTNPESLVTFVKEIQINEEQFYYLFGTATDIKNADGTVRIPAQEAHGLDMDYINSLNMPTITRSIPTPQGTAPTPMKIKEIGVRAAQLAKQIFFEEKGIILEKDDPNLAVLTSAGYVYLNGMVTDMAWDGIYEELGSRLTRSTLLPIHTAPWKPLWFTFSLKGDDGITLDSIYMRYDPLTDSFVVGTGADGKQVNNIGPAALNNQAQLTNLNKNVFKDGNIFNIQTIANAWRNDPPFDQLLTFLFHNHACPGVQPGFFLSDYVFNNFPLGENESYFYMGSSIYCKDDSLIFLMGVSPGMGTYMNQRLLAEEVASELLQGATEEGVLVVWDNELNIGKAYILNFKWATIDLTGLNTSEAKREAQIAAYISIYKNDPNALVQVLPQIVTTDMKYITLDEFNAIKQGGGDGSSALQMLKDLPFRDLEDLIPVDNGGIDDGGSAHDGNGSNGGGNNQGGIIPGVIPGTATGIVGSTPGLEGPTAAAAQVGSTEGQAGGDQPKAYEVNAATTTTTNQDDLSGWAILGVFIVIGLALLGYFFRDSILGS